MFIMDTSNLISPVAKQEPHNYCKLEVAIKSSELSRVSDPAQKRQSDAGMGNMVSAAENSSVPEYEVDKQ